MVALPSGRVALGSVRWISTYRSRGAVGPGGVALIAATIATGLRGRGLRGRLDARCRRSRRSGLPSKHISLTDRGGIRLRRLGNLTGSGDGRGALLMLFALRRSIISDRFHRGLFSRVGFFMNFHFEFCLFGGNNRIFSMDGRVLSMRRQLLSGQGARLNGLSLHGLTRLLAILEIVMGDDFRLRFFQHDLFLHHDNLFLLGRRFFLGLRLRCGSLSLCQFRLFDEMDFLLRVLGIIRHILPFTLPGRRYIQNSAQRRTRGNSSYPESPRHRNRGRCTLRVRRRWIPPPPPELFRYSLR